MLGSLLISFTAGVLSEKLHAAKEKQASVTGIGGIFFKAKDPKALRNWYAQNLGLNMDQSGTNFQWRRADDQKKSGFTQ